MTLKLGGMTNKPTTFAELVSLWKPIRLLASDLGCKRHTVYQWRLRGSSINPIHWPALTQKARERHGLELTPDDFYRMAVAASMEIDAKQDAA